MAGVNDLEMTTRFGFRRSRDVKEVIHIRANKFSGYFNADCKKFAVDPHVTTFSDIKEILINAFNLDSHFSIKYLCRDDNGDNMYLPLNTEWDLDAAFLTSSDPYLCLKVEISSSRKESKNYNVGIEKSKESIFGFGSSTAFQVPRGWSELAENALAKITGSIGQSLSPSHQSDLFFPKKPPLGDCELHDYLDRRGKLVRPEDLRLRIYYGGVEPSQRKVVWRILLNIFPESLTAEERIVYMKRKTKEYHSLYMQWKSLRGNGYVEDLKKMIWKDVLRTDRSHPYFSGTEDNPHLISLLNLLLTYALTHENVRYCQGMSDIAAPILVVMNNEPHAYVCFCGLMKRLEKNFHVDGIIMTKKFEHLASLLKHQDPEYFEFLKNISADNMYFCYRWLLLEMKREFDFNDALRVLEVMWSSLPPQPPKNELLLGTLSLKKVSALDRLKHVTAEKKRNSLPDLTLNVRNLPAALNVRNSSEDLKIPGEKNVTSNKNEAVFHSKPTSSRHQLFKQRKGYAPLQTYDMYDSNDDAYTLAHGNVISHRDDGTDFSRLPPPEELGCGNPFLLFICLAVLLGEKEELVNAKVEYADLVMHFDKMIRRHSPAKILSKAMQLFASYLRSQSSVTFSS